MIQNATGIVKDHYDLGELLGVEELHGGYCNRSFAVTVKKNGRSFKYLLRGYNPAAAEKEIKFEHALISHLKKNGLPIVAGVIPAISGGTYVKADSTIEGQLITGFWAVFEFLEGDDRYTWIDTDLAARTREIASWATRDPRIGTIHLSSRIKRVSWGARRLSRIWSMLEMIWRIPGILWMHITNKTAKPKTTTIPWMRSVYTSLSSPPRKV